MTKSSLRPCDRAFLHDYIQFGYMHHVIAAEAFRRAYEHAAHVAARMRAEVERLDRDPARLMATRLNDAARVQTVCVARLLSELAATLEDLGAMMHAIRHRARRGVMAEYLGAEVSASSDVFDLLLRGEEFFALLKLPLPSRLSHQLDEQAMVALENDHASMGATLGQMATMYRDQGPDAAAAANAPHPPDRVAIVLDVLDEGHANARRRGGLLVRAHNKTKHRFSVIEDIEALGTAADAGIRYAHYPRDQRWVMRLVQNVTQVALASAELAALVLTIDMAASQEAGVTPDR